MDKNPKKVEAGKKAAAARWGDPRVVRLDELTPAQRRLVVALVDAAKEANVPQLDDFPPDEREAIKAAIAAKKAAKEKAAR